jgi:hypothetical protein
MSTTAAASFHLITVTCRIYTGALQQQLTYILIPWIPKTTAPQHQQQQ